MDLWKYGINDFSKCLNIWIFEIHINEINCLLVHVVIVHVHLQLCDGTKFERRGLDLSDWIGLLDFWMSMKIKMAAETWGPTDFKFSVVHHWWTALIIFLINHADVKIKYKTYLYSARTDGWEGSDGGASPHKERDLILLQNKAAIQRLRERFIIWYSRLCSVFVLL